MVIEDSFILLISEERAAAINCPERLDMHSQINLTFAQSSLSACPKPMD